MLVVKPLNPGKYIGDLLREGLEYAVRNNVKEILDAPNITGVWDDCEIPEPREPYVIEREELPLAYRLALGTGFIFDMLESPKYNYKPFTK